MDERGDIKKKWTAGAQRKTFVFCLSSPEVSRNRQREQIRPSPMLPPPHSTRTPLHNLPPHLRSLSTGSESRSAQALTRVPEREREELD